MTIEQRSKTVGGSPQYAHPPASAAARASVLMVDDQPARLLTYEAILAGIEVECVRAQSGDEALACLLTREFAVILLDVHMPGMDGFELARLIRNHPRMEHTPIIFITGVHVSELDQLKGYKVGAMDYIAVPVVPEILRSKVALLVELHLRREELRALNEELEQARARLDVKYASELAARDAQLRAVFEHPDEVTIVLQAVRNQAGAVEDWVYLNANSSALNLFRLPRGKVIGHRLGEVVPEERAQIAAARCAQVHESQASMRYESDYAGRHFLVTIYPAGLDMVISTAVDITDRKRVDEALRESQERLLLAKSAARLGIYDWDVSTGVLQWDERLHELWGIKPGEAVTYELFIQSLHPEDRHGTQLAVDRALDPSGDGRYAAVYRVVNRIDGKTRWIEAIGRAFFDGGRAVRLVGTVQDITQRRVSEQALKEADRRKDEFLAMLAHELRNPVAPISNAAEILSRMLTSDAKASSLVAMIQRQGVHLSRILDDLLDVARITQGRIELRREAVVVSTCIDMAIEAVQPLMRAKNHELTVTRSCDPPHVSVDKVRLEQCIGNLLNNAAKYTDPGGRIQVRYYAEAQEAVIEVADSGIGVPAAFLPRVFDLFAQSERSLDRSQGGLGIGLAVCRQLIEMHGGSVSCVSAGPGQGSTFTIRLPLLEDRVVPVQRAESPVERTLRVLIVDDNEDAADSLAMCLELDGHEAIRVYSGESALQQFASFDPQLVLLDIGLPLMDGYEVARRLRASGGSVRLVALSGYGQQEDKQRARDAGFDAHLTKPVDMSSLRQLMTSIPSHCVGNPDHAARERN